MAPSRRAEASLRADQEMPAQRAGKSASPNDGTARKLISRRLHGQNGSMLP